MQNGVAVVVGEADVLQLQMSLRATDRNGGGGISLFLGLPLDLTEPAQRGLALLEFVEVVGDVGNGVNQHHKPSEVTAEASDGQVIALNPPGGEAKNGKQADDLNHSHNRVLKRHQAVGAMASLPVLIDLVFKSALKPRLSGEGTHQGQSFNCFSQQSSQLADFFLAALGGSHHLGPKQADQPDD